MRRRTGKMSRYGLCGKLVARGGKRAQVVGTLRKTFAGASTLDGCLLYLVFEDAEDMNAIWVTELWTSKEAHDRSLANENVRKAIEQVMPNIDREKMLQAKLKPLFGVGMPE